MHTLRIKYFRMDDGTFFGMTVTEDNRWDFQWSAYGASPADVKNKIKAMYLRSLNFPPKPADGEPVYIEEVTC